MNLKKYVDLHNNQIYLDKNKYILEFYEDILKEIDKKNKTGGIKNEKRKIYSF